MKLVIALIVLAMAGSAGFAAWAGHRSHHDGVRTIHYGANYDASSQRRLPPGAF